MSSSSCRCTAKAYSATTASWRSRCSRAAAAFAAIQFRSTDPSLFDQALAAGQIQLRLFKRHLRLQQGAPRRLQLGLHQPQRNLEGNLANGANDLNI